MKSLRRWIHLRPWSRIVWRWSGVSGGTSWPVGQIHWLSWPGQSFPLWSPCRRHANVVGWTWKQGHHFTLRSSRASCDLNFAAWVRPSRKSSASTKSRQHVARLLRPSQAGWWRTRRKTQSSNAKRLTQQLPCGSAQWEQDPLRCSRTLQSDQRWANLFWPRLEEFFSDLRARTFCKRLKVYSLCPLVPHIQKCDFVCLFLILVFLSTFEAFLSWEMGDWQWFGWALGASQGSIGLSSCCQST